MSVWNVCGQASCVRVACACACVCACVCAPLSDIWETFWAFSHYQPTPGWGSVAFFFSIGGSTNIALCTLWQITCSLAPARLGAARLVQPSLPPCVTVEDWGRIPCPYFVFFFELFFCSLLLGESVPRQKGETMTVLIVRASVVCFFQYFSVLFTFHFLLFFPQQVMTSGEASSRFSFAP